MDILRLVMFIDIKYEIVWPSYARNISNDYQRMPNMDTPTPFMDTPCIEKKSFHFQDIGGRLFIKFIPKQSKSISCA